MSDTPPKFKKGTLVQRGHQGKVPYRVLAVITTGRTVTYDIKSEGQSFKGHLIVAVREIDLRPYRLTKE